MSLPFITMLPASGTIPTLVHLPDGGVVFPNSSGQISVASNQVAVMMEHAYFEVYLLALHGFEMKDCVAPILRETNAGYLLYRKFGHIGCLQQRGLFR
jgi:hypothetical protein